MSKETASDDIKRSLTEIFGGTEDGWKRISKKKNDAGETVRAFKNAVLDRRVTVIEGIDGIQRIELPSAKTTVTGPTAETARTAGQFLFAIMGGTYPYAYIRHVDGQMADASTVHALLKNGVEVAESMWEIHEKGARSATGLAAALKAKGFRWSAELQSRIDGNLTRKIGRHLKP